jgi:hypothetical protein
MKASFTLFLAFFIISVNVMSQSLSDTIQVVQRLGKVYKQNGKTIPAKNLYAILGTNAEAAKEVELARPNMTPAMIFSIAGGACIGWPIGTALGGGDPQWWLAGVGAGFIICSIPFQAAYNKHIFKAVTIYNSDLRKIGINRKILELGFARHGVGIEIRF